jgi:DNA-binding Lrp family transcriptional regulator
MIPDRLWMDARLHAADVHVWCALAYVARGREAIDPTNAALAKLVNLSERSVSDSITRLAATGFVARTGKGRNRTLALRPEGDGTPAPGLVLKVVG